jgi:hypothetical protein
MTKTTFAPARKFFVFFFGFGQKNIKALATLPGLF